MQSEIILTGGKILTKINNMKNDYVPVIEEDYIPVVVQRLINKIDFEKFKTIALYGFSNNMKWLHRKIKGKDINVILCDWREKFIGYDCGGEYLVSIDKVENSSSTVLICCIQDVNLIKEGIAYLIAHEYYDLKCIFDNDLPNNPFLYENPYKSIAIRAIKRAKSMISNAQLFDLMQYIEQTSDVEGDVVEYGSLYGGSGAILTEAVNSFCKNKKIWLFDSFKGIPESKYGLDYHWTNSFSDNSFKEVENAFKDQPNVKVVEGDINKTYASVEGSISFGYIASDTFETGKLLLDFIWPKLSKGGIIAICDYGSFPNCYPLTVCVDEFIKKERSHVFVFRPDKLGIFIMKK